MRPDANDRLEEFVDRALRAQPLRRAPASLEARVTEELLRRAALPWWRRSFLHWPIPARALFALTCAVLARLSFEMVSWIGGGTHGLVASGSLVKPVEWTQHLMDVANSMGELLLVVVRNIPAPWLVGVLVAAAACYAMFFGLCATAYWTLFSHQTHQR